MTRTVVLLARYAIITTPSPDLNSPNYNQPLQIFQSQNMVVRDRKQ